MTILKGIAASSGVLKGRVRVYAPGAVITKDDIFLAVSTNPSMSFQMANSKAVVTQRGGLLSHAAIFCRELGIPCVVGVENLLEIIKDGSLIIVDGDKGTIEVVD